MIKFVDDYKKLCEGLENGDFIEYKECDGVDCEKKYCENENEVVFNKKCFDDVKVFENNGICGLSGRFYFSKEEYCEELRENNELFYIFCENLENEEYICKGKSDCCLNACEKRFNDMGKFTLEPFCDENFVFYNNSKLYCENYCQNGFYPKRIGFYNENQCFQFKCYLDMNDVCDESYNFLTKVEFCDKKVENRDLKHHNCLNGGCNVKKCKEMKCLAQFITPQTVCAKNLNVENLERDNFNFYSSVEIFCGSQNDENNENIINNQKNHIENYKKIQNNQNNEKIQNIINNEIPILCNNNPCTQSECCLKNCLSKKFIQKCDKNGIFYKTQKNYCKNFCLQKIPDCKNSDNKICNISECCIKKCENKKNDFICNSNFELIFTNEDCKKNCYEKNGDFFLCENNCEKSDCEFFKCLSDFGKYGDFEICSYNRKNGFLEILGDFEIFCEKKKFDKEIMIFSCEGENCDKKKCEEKKCLYENENFEKKCKSGNFEIYDTKEIFCKEKIFLENFEIAKCENEICDEKNCCLKKCEFENKNNFKNFCSENFKILNLDNFCEKSCSEKKKVKIQNCFSENNEIINCESCLIFECLDFLENYPFENICLFSENSKNPENLEISKNLKNSKNSKIEIFSENQFFFQKKNYCKFITKNLPHEKFTIPNSLDCSKNKKGCKNYFDCCKSKCLKNPYKIKCSENFKQISHENFCEKKCQNLNKNFFSYSCKEKNCSIFDCENFKCLENLKNFSDDFKICLKFEKKFSFFLNKKNFCQNQVFSHLENFDIKNNIVFCDKNNGCEKNDCCKEECMSQEFFNFCYKNENFQIEKKKKKF